MGLVSLAATGFDSLFRAHSATPHVPDSNSTPQARKLYQECQQFEGILISSLWSEMDQGVSMTDTGSDPGASTMQGLGIQSASMGLASLGGLGIARMLYQELAPQLSPVAAASGKRAT